MKTLNFNSSRDFKKAFNTISGNIRPNQIELLKIDSINGTKVNNGYAHKVINLTNKGVEFFNNERTSFKSPFIIVLK